ncbi:MAG: HU family DNA-binding protein [Syntrophorhabdales bacterium]
MTKTRIANQLSEQAHVNQKLAKLAVNAIVDIIKKAIISGERVEIRGFGNFSLRSYKPYKGRNPQNGETIEVPAKRLPYFKVGKDLNEMIQKDH